ncbi:hypothetical protein ACFFJQ_06945 [Bacillus capparidis]|uniref:Uncharacterized protein n=1 Tax=Bacillus capparidis TaxID=1840411 RepID=A0ABS4D1J7_9BACI|nr:hypothetical protein [Bacillus capparidis]MBP1083504.1 hypothetical protein [Bacillus capparidis]MED1094703.1 hypothetical protein [Bacillus capparidis]
MSLSSFIINTLKPIGVPVRFQTLLESDGNPPTYIKFFEYHQSGALHGDDKELNSSHSIQVDIFSIGNYSSLVKQVKELLTGIGFTRTFETELYETDTKLYHKVLRFHFVQ